MPARSFIPPNSIAEYGAMIGDRLRADAYAAALRQAVRADSVVLDIGTGAGTFALLACQLGARRVIGVEPGDVIELARELAVANGYVDRMELIQDVSTSITLAEPADVIVSDLRGAVPLHGRHLPAVAVEGRFSVPGSLPFSEPIALGRGDTVSVDLQASLIAGAYTWRWHTRAWAQGQAGSEFANFAQSDFHIVLPSQLRRVAPTHTPTLNESGQLHALVLERMSKQTALEQIGARGFGPVSGRFREPGRRVRLRLSSDLRIRQVARSG